MRGNQSPLAQLSHKMKKTKQNECEQKTRACASVHNTRVWNAVVGEKQERRDCSRCRGAEWKKRKKKSHETHPHLVTLLRKRNLGSLLPPGLDIDCERLTDPLLLVVASSIRCTTCSLDSTLYRRQIRVFNTRNKAVRVVKQRRVKAHDEINK